MWRPPPVLGTCCTRAAAVVRSVATPHSIDAGIRSFARHTSAGIDVAAVVVPCGLLVLTASHRVARPRRRWGRGLQLLTKGRPCSSRCRPAESLDQNSFSSRCNNTSRAVVARRCYASACNISGERSVLVDPERNLDSAEAQGRGDLSGGSGVAAGLRAPRVDAINSFRELVKNPRSIEHLSRDAFYYPSLLADHDDRTVFDQLVDEMNFRPCWLNTGMPFTRNICLGSDELLARAPTYRAVVEHLVGHFGVRAVRSLGNLYRNGEDWCNPHSDQYQQGGYPIDLTIGVTFGNDRELLFMEAKRKENQIHVPQRNGDVFAFSDNVNRAWKHMVPKTDSKTGPRISIIVWCSRDKMAPGEDRGLHSLGNFPHMLHHNPKRNEGYSSDQHRQRDGKNDFRKNSGRRATDSWRRRESR